MVPFLAGVVVGFVVALVVGRLLIADAKKWGELLVNGVESRLKDAIEKA